MELPKFRKPGISGKDLVTSVKVAAVTTAVVGGFVAAGGRVDSQSVPTGKQLTFHTAQFGPFDGHLVDDMVSQSRVVDVNGDGLLDVYLNPNILLIQNPNTHQLEQKKADIQVPGLNWADPKLADLNKDGLIDITYYNGEDGTIDTVLQKKPLVFGDPRQYDIKADMAAGTVKDFDGDGFPDLISPMYKPQIGSDEGISVYLNDRLGGFRIPALNFFINDAGAHIPYQADMADLNGDAKPDPFLIDRMSATVGGDLTMFLSPNYNPYQGKSPLQFVELGQYPHIAQLDGDRISDLVLSGDEYRHYGINVVWGGSFEISSVKREDLPEFYRWTLGGANLNPGAGDIDKDNQDELLINGYYTDEVTIYDSNNRLFTKRQALKLPAKFQRMGSFEANVGDLDNNGRPDIQVMVKDHEEDGKKNVVIFYQDESPNPVVSPTPTNSSTGAEASLYFPAAFRNWLP